MPARHQGAMRDVLMSPRMVGPDASARRGPQLMDNRVPEQSWPDLLSARTNSFWRVCGWAAVGLESGTWGGGSSEVFRGSAETRQPAELILADSPALSSIWAMKVRLIFSTFGSQHRWECGSE